MSQDKKDIITVKEQPVKPSEKEIKEMIVDRQKMVDNKKIIKK